MSSKRQVDSAGGGVRRGAQEASCISSADGISRGAEASGNQKEIK